MLISRSSRPAASGKRFLIFSPPIAPSTTTCPTWMPSAAYSFAIACASVRSPAFDELNAP
jgi:hypothetical protein